MYLQPIRAAGSYRARRARDEAPKPFSGAWGVFDVFDTPKGLRHGRAAPGWMGKRDGP